MYAENRAEIERLGKEFDRLAGERSAGARAAGEEYMKSLGVLINAYHDGPAADPRLTDLDTTGELQRVEEYIQWAEQERHRVRRAIRDLA